MLVKSVMKLFYIVLTMLSIQANAELSITLSGGEWPPYVSEKLKYNGVTPRLITDVFASVGIKVSYRFQVWARSIEDAKKSKVHGTFLWFKTPEREKEFLFSDQPIGYITFVFFHLKNRQFDWKNFNDLHGLRIGATIGYNYGQDFMDAEASSSLQVVRVKSDLQNLKMLLKNRIDIFPHDLSVGYFEINKFFPKTMVQLFTNHNKPLKKQGAYLLLSNKIEKNKEIMSLFNKGFNEFMDSGKYEQYYFDDLVNNVYVK